MVEGEVEELKGLKAIAMGSKEATKDVFNKWGGDGGRREVVEECGAEGLVRERVIIDDSGDGVCVNWIQFGCGAWVRGCLVREYEVVNCGCL